MFDGRFRQSVDRGMKPVGRALRGLGLSPDVITAMGLAAAAGTAVAIGAGIFPLAIGLLIVSGAFDVLDGAVAKATGSGSVRGAFFDSVSDRLADALLLSGAAWYLVDHGEGHLVLLPFAILAVSFLISYERAKADALNISARGGLMERAERMIVLGVAMVSHEIFVPVLFVMLGLTTLTAVGRFRKIWTAAGRPEPTVRRRAFVQRFGGERIGVQDRTMAAVARWRTVRVEARTRAQERREARAHRRASRSHRSRA